MTWTEKMGLTALALLAAVPPPPSSPTPGVGKSGKPIAQANVELELPEFDPKNLPECAEEFAEFLLLTGRSHVDVATKCSLLKRSCKKKLLQKQVKQIVKICSTWAEILQRLEKSFPLYETDLSVRTQIEELPMLPEFPSAARVSEYLCDLQYLFSRMNVVSYGATEPHLWLMSKIPTCAWDDCRTTSERKSRTHTYYDLVDLLIKLALERETQGQWWQRWTHTQLWELRKWARGEPSLEGLVHRPGKGSVENCRLRPAGGGCRRPHGKPCWPMRSTPWESTPATSPRPRTTRMSSGACGRPSRRHSETASACETSLKAQPRTSTAPQEPCAPHNTTRLTPRPAAPPPNHVTQQTTTAGRHARLRPEAIKRTGRPMTPTHTTTGTTTPKGTEPRPATVATV